MHICRSQIVNLIFRYDFAGGTQVFRSAGILPAIFSAVRYCKNAGETLALQNIAR
jgi:hypothetical protein